MSSINSDDSEWTQVWKFYNISLQQDGCAGIQLEHASRTNHLDFENLVMIDSLENEPKETWSTISISSSLSDISISSIPTPELRRGIHLAEERARLDMLIKQKIEEIDQLLTSFQ